MQLNYPPTTLFIELTTECNSRCRYCHMWMLEDDSRALTLDEKHGLIAEFSRLNPNGEVVFTGGETMRRKEDFFSLTRHCRDRGLRSAANTNGSYITPDDDETLLRDGPTFLVFSLDSDDPEIHDYNRGIPGGLEATTSTISRLLAARKRAPAPAATEIITNSVLLEGNIDGLFDLLDFLQRLSVDGATFQILSPTFHRKGPEDNFYKRHFFKNKTGAVETLQRLIKRLPDYPFVRTTATDLRWMQRYILFPDALAEGVCGSHERNMMVDHRGEVQLCFNMRKIFGGKSIGNVRSASLAAMWAGETAGEAREIMQGCRETCGMLNCHRKAT